MKIGLMGFDCSSPNKGCEALTYSFLNILAERYPHRLEVHVFGYLGLGNIAAAYPGIIFEQHRLHLKNPRYLLKLKKAFDTMDCIFDITFGDGFSDIYGRRWNVVTDLVKQVAIWSKAPLVLPPQTYGPYYNRWLRLWAHRIIARADLVFARDSISAREINAVIGEKVLEATDLAFALPYDRQMYPCSSEKLKIGVNISALLWYRGHADTIRLRTDYQAYCRQLLANLTAREDVELHLIPHVVNKEDYDDPENDVRACRELYREFPAVAVAPEFENPVQAKSYIANMDVFIGARMHATIAAISSGVATIPFSYSKKFEGLFGNLNYPYLVSGTVLETGEAVEKTIGYIENRQELTGDLSEIIEITQQKLGLFCEQLDHVMTK